MPSLEEQKTLRDHMRDGAEADSIMEMEHLVRILFYGDIGMGKTSLAIKTFHEIGERAALFYTDSAWSIITKHPEIAKKIKPIKFRGLGMIDNFIDGHNLQEEWYEDFDTIIWDTASTGTDRVLRNLVDTKKVDAKHMIDPMVEGRPHYRMAERYLRATIEKLNESNLHVIYTAHERKPTEEDIKASKFAIRPAMPEACYKVLAQEVQGIGWLSKEQGQSRQIQFEPTRLVTAKTQIPTIEEKTYQVNEIPNLIKKWRVQ